MSKMGDKIEKMLNEANEIHRTNPVRGCELSLEALRISREHKMEQNEGEALIHLILCYRVMSKYEEALDCAEQALSIFMRIEDDYGLMRLNNLIGILYYYNGIYERAIYHLNDSYNVAKKRDNKKVMISTLNNMGEVHKKAGNYNDAMELYNTSADLANELSLRFHYGVITQNKGDIFMIQGDLENAEECFHLAYVCFLEAEDSTSFPELFLNMGRLYLRREQTERARSYFESALNSLELIDNKYYKLDLLMEMYKIDSKIEPCAALEYLLKAQKMALEARVEHKLSDIEFMLHEHYEKKGDHERALFHFKTYHNLLKKLDANNLILKLKILKLESMDLSFDTAQSPVSKIMTHEIENEKEKIKLLESSNAELSYKAMHDTLTGLPNRRRIDSKFEELSLLIEQSDQGINLAVYMLDIDHFKMVNDSMGHLFGDHCLESIGMALNDIAAEFSGFVGRFGGEEFIFIANSVDDNKAIEIGERLNKTIKSLGIDYMVDEQLMHLTISVGGLFCKNIETLDKRFIIELADRALYLAKAAGRDNFVLHDFDHVHNLILKENSN